MSVWGPFRSVSGPFRVYFGPFRVRFERRLVGHEVLGRVGVGSGRGGSVREKIITTLVRAHFFWLQLFCLQLEASCLQCSLFTYS